MNINELGLKEEAIEVDWDSLPEQGGTFYPTPYPGTYRFRLPDDLTTVWTKVETKEQGEWPVAFFDRDFPLTITYSVTEKEARNDPWTTRISSVPFPRGKEGVKASDMDYLLKALGESARPSTRVGYAQALMRHAGEEFVADVTWTAYCNPERNIYVTGESGLEELEGVTGCGRRFSQRDIPKDGNGKYLETFTCDFAGCSDWIGADNSGAPPSLRCFGNLRNFRPVPENVET